MAPETPSVHCPKCGQNIPLNGIGGERTTVSHNCTAGIIGKVYGFDCEETSGCASTGMAPESERANTAETAARGIYFADNFARGRGVITLRGVRVFLDHCDCDDHKDSPPDWNVEYPRMGPLCELVRANPDKNDFTYDGENWRVTDAD